MRELKLIAGILFVSALVLLAYDRIPKQPFRVANAASKPITTKPPLAKALLTTRFESLEDFEKAVHIDYRKDGAKSIVILTYSTDQDTIISTLSSGVDQGDILQVRDQGFIQKVGFVLKEPYPVRIREELAMIYMMARRRHHLFGEGDVAFFDLAEAAVERICTDQFAFQNRRDSSEKGYVNTFNHVTAQALITTFFSKNIADFMADVHEREYMPELTTGVFSDTMMADTVNNPLDNYVDMINNELGQQIGNYLKHKYQIHPDTRITPKLLADYLNDLNSFYSWSFGMGMRPFSEEDELLIRFSAKLNRVLDGSVT